MSIFQTITPADINVVPFKSYKHYEWTEADITTSGIRVYDGIYSGISYNLGDLSDPTVLTLSSTFGFYNYLLHDSIYNSFYKDFIKAPYNLLESYNLNQYRFLYGSIKIVTIPQIHFGENIKPGTFRLWDSSFGTYYTIYDDGYGNLIDSGSYSEYLLKIHNSDDILIAYWDFYDIYRLPEATYDKKNNIPAYSHDIELSDSINYLPVPYFKGNINSYLQISNSDKFNFIGSDSFSIQFYLEPDTIQNESDSIYSTIITKNGAYKDNQSDSSIQYIKGNFPYPFQIEMINTGVDKYKIRASVYDGNNLSEVVSTIPANDSLVLFTRSNGTIQLYINGVLDNIAIDNTKLLPNICDIFIGKNGNDTKVYTGKISNLMIFSGSLDNPTDFYDLFDNKTYDYKVGNIFYNSGCIIISSPYYFKYLGLFSGHVSSSLQYNSTKTIYEYEINCHIPANRLNHTTNLTTLANPNLSTKYASFVSSSEFSPYITTIGLYNDNLNLIAVAKLNKPIKKPTNHDLTFVVKFDT